MTSAVDGRGAYKASFLVGIGEGRPVVDFVERRSLGGTIESRLEFADWLEVGDSEFLFPKRISITDFDPDGTVTMRMTFQIDKIEVDVELPVEQFRPVVRADTAISDAAQTLHPEIPSVD